MRLQLNNLQSTLAGLQPLSDSNGRLQPVPVSNAARRTPAQDSSRHDIATTDNPVETQLVSNNESAEPQLVSEALTSSIGKTKKVKRILLIKVTILINKLGLHFPPQPS